MAELTLIYNSILILIPFFELGISASYLRYFQIKQKLIFNFSIMQLIILLSLIFLSNSHAGDIALNILNLNQLDLSKQIFSLLFCVNCHGFLLKIFFLPEATISIC